MTAMALLVSIQMALLEQVVDSVVLAEEAKDVVRQNTEDATKDSR